MRPRGTLSLAADEVEHTIRIGLRTAGVVRYQKATRSWAAFTDSGEPLGAFADVLVAGRAVIAHFAARLNAEPGHEL